MEDMYKSEYPNIIEQNSETGVESIKSLLEYDYYENRTIWVNGSFEDPMQAIKIVIAMEYLDKNGDDDIILKIFNYGGAVDCLWTIINAMNRCKCDIRTEIHGEASSVAGMIFINGTKGKRFMTPNSFLMLHEMRWSNNENTFSFNSNQHKNYYEVGHNNFAKFIADKMGKTLKETKNWLKKDNWMTPENAIKLGLCDHILN